MKITNKTKNKLLAENAAVARGFFERLKGLLGREKLGQGEALIIERCNAIHSFFMSFAIDVIFLDQNNKVVGLSSDFRPWQFSALYWKAKSVVELPVGVINKSSTQIEDELGLS